MGGEVSQACIKPDVVNTASQFFNLLPDSYIDVGIEDTLLMYSGTDSTARLSQYSSSLRDLPIYIEKAGGALKGFTPVPNAVGLGAFVIYMILQATFGAMKEQSSLSTIDALRRVFAEEKSSNVRDLIIEYLKRYEMHLRDDRQLLVDSERLETQLSLQLTKLRNSMLVDKQMSSPAVKQWVNGAAFHVQVLLHIARLRKRTETGTQGFQNAKIAASNALDIYNRKMMEILDKYKEYKLSTFQLRDLSSCFMVDMGPACVSHCTFKETEINYEFNEVHPFYCTRSSQSYLDHIFSNHKQLIEIKEYFSNLQKNLEVLVSQTESFKIQ